MKRNLILSIAVAVLMLASEVAWAADVTFSGQFRPRYQVVQDSQDATSPDKYFDTRVRLNAKANVNANTEVFVQLQSVGAWGTADAQSNGTRVQQGQGSPQATDLLNDVGFHQAFVTLKNLYGHGVTAKIGRQEIVLDGHRLFGHTGWLQGAATQDAMRFTHAAGNHTLQYIYIENLNVGSKTTTAAGDDATHAFHAATQGVMGGALSGLFVIQDDRGSVGSTTDIGIENTWYTIGARQKGKAGGLDYRVEYYHQFGDGQVPGTSFTGTTGVGSTVYNALADIDRDAHLFGVRIGKTFKNAKMSPTVTLWYDRLSGNDDDDVTGSTWGGFDTMYDTGHKFYGFMDAYLSRAMLGTNGMGLTDIAIKVKMTPKAGWTAKADLHWLSTTVDMDGDNATTVAANTLLNDATSQGNSMGSELDLTLAHKYDANTKIQAGWSHYWTTNTFALLNGFGTIDAIASNQDSDWFYIQADTKF